MSDLGVLGSTTSAWEGRKARELGWVRSRVWESSRFCVSFVSPFGCVAYGLGFVVVSLAPPSQLGPMVMAAPPSPLLVPFLLRAPRIGCVAYGMGCVVVSLAPPSQPGPMVMAAPLSSLLFPFLLRSLPLPSCVYHCLMSSLTGQ